MCLTIVWKKKIIGLEEYTLYILERESVTFPSNFKTILTSDSDAKYLNSQKIKYDDGENNISIPIKDLMFFFDMPSGINTSNIFETESRLKGLYQTLINTLDSLIAKNIILKTNGKELITKNKDSVQMDPKEKAEAQRVFNLRYGLGHGKSRSVFTNADLNHKSLHIPLRDLGLDDSVKVDGNLIYTALHIPKDILSLEAKKTTYNNYKESMVSFIQNEIQGVADDCCAVINKHYKVKGSYSLKGNFDHVPVMQYIMLERYEVRKKLGEALKILREAGIPDEDCLEILGLDKGIQLKEILNETESANEQGEGIEENGDS